MNLNDPILKAISAGVGWVCLARGLPCERSALRELLRPSTRIGFRTSVNFQKACHLPKNQLQSISRGDFCIKVPNSWEGFMENMPPVTLGEELMQHVFCINPS